MQADTGAHAFISSVFANWATNYVHAVQADNGRFLVRNSMRLEKDVEDPAAYARWIFESVISMVYFLLVSRFASRPLGCDKVDRAMDFLQRQTYGVPDEDRDAVFGVYIMDVLESPVYLKSLDEIDFSDFRGISFSHMIIDHIHGDMTHAEASEVASRVHTGLNRNMDFPLDAWFQHNGNMIVIGIHGKSVSPTQPGLLVDAGEFEVEECNS